MATQKTADQLLLKEPTVEYGTWANPQNIVVGTDPLDSWTQTNDLGFIRQGTVKLGISDTYVEYLSSTPQEIVAKDLIRRDVTVEFTLSQFNKDLISIFGRQLTETGTYELMHLGLDVPTEIRYGFLLSGQLRDGTALYFAVYSGAVVTEDQSIAPPGTDYTDKPGMIQAFRHSGFTDTFTTNQKCYGLIWKLA